MLIGRAIGGPRDGVKLICPTDWNGRIQVPRNKESMMTRYYPGRYVWRNGTWVWQSCK